VLTVWLADGSNFPGQMHFRKSFEYTLDSLRKIYSHMPDDWIMLVEYKPYEPNFYSTVIQDWGSSLLLSMKTGDRCYSLIDLGHHLPNTNIEQIVSRLMMEGKLGGFHFNDSKYGDDDLTVGSIKPYQLFLIFNELVDAMNDQETVQRTPAWMIDASHNVKDPLEDLLQSIEAIQIGICTGIARQAYGSCHEHRNPTMSSKRRNSYRQRTGRTYVPSLLKHDCATTLPCIRYGSTGIDRCGRYSFTNAVRRPPPQDYNYATGYRCVRYRKNE
jgi:L-rhamnose isomerase / sugar isomerase